MTDEEKLKYSKFIQNKYIVDFNEYLKILNKGRISLHKRQIVEWVEALRIFSPEVLDQGWKKWIQMLRPNFVPSITDGIEHFKAINEMADKEKDIDAKSSFKSGAREHAKLLKKAESVPEYQSVARKHREKIVDKIEEVFETDPIYRGNKSPI